MRRRVHGHLVVLASGGAALVVVIGATTTWGHLNTGAHERTLLALTTAQRLNIDVDAAHEELQGTLLSAVEWRAGGLSRAEPDALRAATTAAAGRLQADLAQSADLRLSASLSRLSATVRAGDDAYGTRVINLIATALDGHTDLRVQRAELAKAHQRQDVVRADFTSRLQAAATAAARSNSRARAIAIAVVWSSVAVALALIWAMFAGIRRSVLGVTRRLQDLLQQNESEAARGEFGRHVVEAFDMADDEEAARQVVARAMMGVSPELPMELLLADSSKAHLARAAGHPAAGTPGCPVATPFECVAVRRGTAVTFADSEQLHACPKLRDRKSGPVSAACVPITFMGRAIGVLHASGPQGEPPDGETVDRLARLAAHAGARIGTLRATRQTQLQAATDALTGLVNRRTLDHHVRDLLTGDRSFALVFSDLDHFKALNDTYGHDAGDRALRLFAKVLRDGTRTDDVLARYGGEEFVLVLPDRSASEAVEAMQRIRLSLADAVSTSDAPLFTASFGVTDSSMGMTVTDIVRIADGALLAAKSNGRDQVVLAGNTQFAGLVPDQVPDLA